GRLRCRDWLGRPAGVQANLKLTFCFDHRLGADHPRGAVRAAWPICCSPLAPSPPPAATVTDDDCGMVAPYVFSYAAVTSAGAPNCLITPCSNQSALLQISRTSFRSCDATVRILALSTTSRMRRLALWMNLASPVAIISSIIRMSGSIEVEIANARRRNI